MKKRHLSQTLWIDFSKKKKPSICEFEIHIGILSVMLFIVVQSANMGICGGSGSGEKWYPTILGWIIALTAVVLENAAGIPVATGVHANSQNLCSFQGAQGWPGRCF